MIGGLARDRNLPMVIAIFVTAQAILFWLGAIAHTGIELSLGDFVVAEPRIIPAIIVEGICGLVLIASASAVVAGKPWAWNAIIVAQSIALGGVLLGITAIALGAGPHTPANAIFHRVLVVLLVGGLVLSLTPAVKRSFERKMAGIGRGIEQDTGRTLTVR